MLLVSQWSKSSENDVLDLRFQRVPLVFLRVPRDYLGLFLRFFFGFLRVPFGAPYDSIGFLNEFLVSSL